MKEAQLLLTDAQLRKLVSGQGIMIKKECMGCGDMYMLHPMKIRRMMTAMKKGKGMRLTFSPDEMAANEIEIEGGRINFGRIGRAIRKGAAKVGELYREYVRPTVGPALKQLVEKGISKGATKAVEAGLTAVGAPELAAIAGPEIQRGIEKYVTQPASEFIQKKTGAYGIKKSMPKKKKNPKPSPKPSPIPKSAKKSMVAEMAMGMAMEQPKQLPYKPKLESNYSNFLNPDAPAMNPHLPLPDNSMMLVGDGIFLTSGRGIFLHGGAILNTGLATSPLLPIPDNSMPRFPDNSMPR